MAILGLCVFMPAPPLEATSCAGNGSLLGAVAYHRDRASRVVRARSIHSETEFGPRPMVTLEILEYLDDKALGEVGERIGATGILFYDLNIAPDTVKIERAEMLPDATEWVLLIHIQELEKRGKPYLRYSTQACSSVLRVQDGKVRGFIEGVSKRFGEAPLDQEMSLEELTSKIGEILKTPASSP